MVQQRLAHLVCRPPCRGKAALPPIASIAVPKGEGLAFRTSRQSNMFVATERDRSQSGAESSEGPNPLVGCVCPMNQKMARPIAAIAESLCGIPPTKEMVCAYPRQ